MGQGNREKAWSGRSGSAESPLWGLGAKCPLTPTPIYEAVENWKIWRFGENLKNVKKGCFLDTIFGPWPWRKVKSPSMILWVLLLYTIMPHLIRIDLIVSEKSPTFKFFMTDDFGSVHRLTFATHASQNCNALKPLRLKKLMKVWTVTISISWD
jgi:hypothetical protein